MSGDKRIKEHHFVPKAFQKPFTIDGNGNQIWFSDKEPITKTYREPVLRNIATVFKKRDLYTVLINEKPSDFVERNVYGPLDNDLSLILPYINNELNFNRIPVLTANTLLKMRFVVFEMLKRSPEFGAEQIDEEVGKEATLEVLNDKSLNLSEADIKQIHADLENKKLLKSIGRDAIVRSKIKRMKMVEEALKKYTVRWVKSDSKHSFILSSMCGYRIGNGGSNGLSNINAEVWMPISPKNCLVLIQNNVKNIPLLTTVNGHKIKEVNEHAATYSNAIASHSRELLKSTINRLR